MPSPLRFGGLEPAGGAAAMGSLRARKETPLDVAWRYRSVVALISVPVRAADARLLGRVR